MFKKASYLGGKSLLSSLGFSDVEFSDTYSCIKQDGVGVRRDESGACEGYPGVGYTC